MPIPTPFHERTSQLCTSLFWKDWAGYHAVRSYDTCHQREYHALRHSAGLIDVSPLYKYDVSGPDAGSTLARIMVRDLRKLRLGQVRYLCWCDEDGKVIDDGTVARLEQDRYRVTSNSPARSWLERQSSTARVEIVDRSGNLGVLAVQGPTSREILGEASAEADLSALRFFRMTDARIGGARVRISRTGYTGDLGFEVWVDAADAVAVYDAILAAGRAFRLEPAGLDAMDVARIEAGFVLHGVDYFSALHCLIEARKSSPYEIGLGWCVRLEREPFIGQRALCAEVAREPLWCLVGLSYDWDEYERLFAGFGLPPQVHAGAWREAVPVYDAWGRQVGQATSGAWSPLLKCNLALATVRGGSANPGTRLEIEVTVEYKRRRVTATVTPTPFFDPERKKS